MAVLAALTLAVSGAGVRFGLWDYRAGFEMLRWSAYLGIASALTALVLLVIPKTRRGWRTVLLIALAVSLGVVAVPLRWIVAARSVPPIHDITTDTEDPPKFVAILPLRAKATNTADHGGREIADAQRRGYPDIGPLRLPVPPDVAYAMALAAARAMEWEIVAADTAAGRIEATATTPFFAFKDDVVVRIMPEGGGSRIDVRSVSRVGRSDIGTNARRVRAYLARLG